MKEEIDWEACKRCGNYIQAEAMLVVNAEFYCRKHAGEERQLLALESIATTLDEMLRLRKTDR